MRQWFAWGSQAGIEFAEQTHFCRNPQRIVGQLLPSGFKISAGLHGRMRTAVGAAGYYAVSWPFGLRTGNLADAAGCGRAGFVWGIHRMLRSRQGVDWLTSPLVILGFVAAVAGSLRRGTVEAQAGGA